MREENTGTGVNNKLKSKLRINKNNFLNENEIIEFELAGLKYTDDTVAAFVPYSLKLTGPDKKIQIYKGYLDQNGNLKFQLKAGVVNFSGLDLTQNGQYQAVLSIFDQKLEIELETNTLLWSYSNSKKDVLAPIEVKKMLTRSGGLNMENGLFLIGFGALSWVFIKNRKSNLSVN